MARSGSSRMTVDGAWVAQITKPSPAMMRTISSSGIGPRPLSCTAWYPRARTFRAVTARSGPVRQKSRTV